MERFRLWLATVIFCIFGFWLFEGSQNRRVMRNAEETFRQVAGDVHPLGSGRAPQELIQKVLNSQVEAWNRGDLDAFMTGYWNSEDLTFYSGGDVTKGWNATLARYRKRYQADGKEMGKLTFSDVDVVPAGSEDAFVRGRWKVVTSKDTFEGLFTLRFKKFADGWKIVHDHTSAADPPKKPEPKKE